MIRLRKAGARRFQQLLTDLGSHQAGEGLEIAEGLIITQELPDLAPLAMGDVFNAGAVDIGSTMLFNPDASSVNLEIVGVRASLDTNDEIRAGDFNTVLTGGGTATFLDFAIPGSPQGGVHNQDLAAAGSIHENFFALANTPYDSLVAQGVVLGPGQGWIVRAATTAIGIRTTFKWRERPNQKT